MKIKLDENLPDPLALSLAELGHDVETVREEGLIGATDTEIWLSAQSEERFLITQDLDFSDIRRFVPGSHSGILLVRLQNPSWRSLVKRVESLFRETDPASWRSCLVVATDRKVRVRRPPT